MINEKFGRIIPMFQKFGAFVTISSSFIFIFYLNRRVFFFFFWIIWIKKMIFIMKCENKNEIQKRKVEIFYATRFYVLKTQKKTFISRIP